MFPRRQSKELRRGGVAEPFGHDERLKKYKLRQYAREPTTRDSPAGLGYLTCSEQLSDTEVLNRNDVNYIQQT